MNSDVIYGINPVLEALRAERQILHKVILAGGREGSSLQAVRQLAQKKNIPIQVCPREVLSKLARTEHHQGVIGLQAETLYTSLEELLQSIRKAPGPGLVLLLDGLEDPQNFGSLIRTAEACGLQGIVIPKDRAVGITPAVIKASAGAAAHIPVVRVTNLANTLKELKEEGFWIVGADARGGKSLYEMKFDMNVGLVIGSEGKGIRPLILKKCDYTVSIPLKGKISSLNAAIAGAVILFEILRQQLKNKTKSSE
ncbi:MAG: 23S rRNA (guanosine(2251)-2'-O)-methyltransferase RlmB [Deltaproteobacteria bacterium]|nr:23S rRNA (guanosine(2251)-2'-O)-methyltransferase RlmB [Deltaproteobacteria bacterium]